MKALAAARAEELGRKAKALEQMVSQRLTSSPYLAGEVFTAADISVTYA